MITPDFDISTRDGDKLLPPLQNCVIALGTFDGMHIAHCELIRQAVDLARRTGAEAVGVWCFRDAPAGVLKNEPTLLLNTLQEKINSMISLGADFVAVGDFQSFRSMSARDYIDKILLEQLGCIGAVCGFNHRFGHMGAGNAELLCQCLGHERVVTVPEIKLDGETVSSSAIRAYITQGRIERANEMLGRSFALRAQVVSGKKLGRRLDFPTANQYFPHGIVVPKHGIYATRCIFDGHSYIGVSNVGIRPTITDGTDAHQPNCETYIHGFSGDLYGKELTVEFYQFLREEQRFDSLPQLKEQISKDLLGAIAYFEQKKEK